MQRSLAVALGVPALIGAFGWGVHVVKGATIDAKLDAVRFERDSTRRETEGAQLLSLLRRMDSTVRLTETRVSSIYCADKPPGCR